MENESNEKSLSQKEKFIKLAKENAPQEPEGENLFRLALQRILSVVRK